MRQVFSSRGSTGNKMQITGCVLPHVLITKVPAALICLCAVSHATRTLITASSSETPHPAGTPSIMLVTAARLEWRHVPTLFRQESGPSLLSPFLSFRMLRHKQNTGTSDELKRPSYSFLHHRSKSTAFAEASHYYDVRRYYFLSVYLLALSALLI